MAALRTLFVKLSGDESGAASIEYALLLGMLALGIIAVFSAMGVHLADKWNIIEHAM